MKALFAVKTRDGIEMHPGLASPVLGLAIVSYPAYEFDDVRCDFPLSVTHTRTGLALAWFADAESAAGFILAVGPLADWPTFDVNTPGFFATGEAVNAARRAWGGITTGNRGDGLPITEPAS